MHGHVCGCEYAFLRASTGVNVQALEHHVYACVCIDKCAQLSACISVLTGMEVYTRALDHCIYRHVCQTVCPSIGTEIIFGMAVLSLQSAEHPGEDARSEPGPTDAELKFAQSLLEPSLI